MRPYQLSRLPQLSEVTTYSSGSTSGVTVKWCHLGRQANKASFSPRVNAGRAGNPARTRQFFDTRRCGADGGWPNRVQPRLFFNLLDRCFRFEPGALAFQGFLAVGFPISGDGALGEALPRVGPITEGIAVPG